MFSFVLQRNLLKANLEGDDEEFVLQVLKRLSAVVELNPHSVSAITYDNITATSTDDSQSHANVFRIYCAGTNVHNATLHYSSCADSAENSYSDFPVQGVSLRPKKGFAVRWECGQGIVHKEVVAAGREAKIFTIYFAN